MKKAESRTIYRDLVRHSGKVTITEDEILVQLRARARAHYLVSGDTPNYASASPGSATRRSAYSYRKDPDCHRAKLPR